MIDWMRHRLTYLIISAIVLGVGLFGLFAWGLKLGVDFKGGTIIEYRFENKISLTETTDYLTKNDLPLASIQETGSGNYIFKFAPLDVNQKGEIKELLAEKFPGKIDELRYETVGPSIGPDLIKKTVYALLISAGSILLWIAYRFKSIKFGASAVLAMFHDSLVLIGSFSILGYFFGAEVDFLFVTALLTILSFSVHDTIVNYDRIRESQRKIGGELYDLANKSTSDTMVRSLNNSFTIIFMLVALILMGGDSIKWFAIALLIGTISGTYSSPFVAVSVLVTWDQMEKKVKTKGGLLKFLKSRK
jgi:preprotein translocase subunit SecF